MSLVKSLPREMPLFLSTVRALTSSYWFTSKVASPFFIADWKKARSKRRHLTWMQRACSLPLTSYISFCRVSHCKRSVTGKDINEAAFTVDNKIIGMADHSTSLQSCQWLLIIKVYTSNHSLKLYNLNSSWHSCRK